MAHFAQLDENNKVINVIVVANEDILDETGNESETVGIAFCQNFLGGNWIQTSYNGNIRGKYAGINDIYDVEADRFYSPSLYPSWTLNKTSWIWEAPTPMPTDGGRYRWVEDDLNWQLVEEEPTE
jgi:hypothetical protein